MGGRELLALMKRLAAAERTLSVHSLLQLAEVQRRKLFRDEGFPTMFAYCVGELGYSEGNAFRRLQAVDAARRFPEVIPLIKEGRITICALSVIARHLTSENCGALLKSAEGKSVRDVARFAAELAPRPDKRDTIRVLPAPSMMRPASRAAVATPTEFIIPSVESPVSQAESRGPRSDLPIFQTESQIALADTPVPPTELSAPPPVLPAPPAESSALIPASGHERPRWLRQKITPLSLDRVHFSFTGSEELRRVLGRCSELLWHRFPGGHLEDVTLELGRAYLQRKDPELLPPVKQKPPRSAETRSSPRWVRSVVYRRDGGRCVFVSEHGRRCDARRGLEYDHIVPWAKGGRSDDPANIRLLCRAHNQRAAEIAGLACTDVSNVGNAEDNFSG